MTRHLLTTLILLVVCSYTYAQVPGRKKVQPSIRNNENPIPRAPVQVKMRDTTTKKPDPATVKKTEPETKILSKTQEKDGTTTFVVEEIVNGKKTNVTYRVAKPLNRPFSRDTLNLDSISIQVIKTRNRLYVYHGKNFLTAYKCTFGPNYLQQKKCEGDRCTPEGLFHIAEMRSHKEWTNFFLLDYPTEESKKIFEENLKTGKVPKTARIGGAIGIHGVWAGGDMAIDQKMNWTDGCIALKTNDLIELGSIIKVGTPILIKLK